MKIPNNWSPPREKKEIFLAKGGGQLFGQFGYTCDYWFFSDQLEKKGKKGLAKPKEILEKEKKARAEDIANQ